MTTLSYINKVPPHLKVAPPTLKLFLAAYHQAYDRFTTSTDPAQKNAALELQAVLEKIAVEYDIDPPREVLEQLTYSGNPDAIVFASSDEARKGIFDFYHSYKGTVVSRKRELLVLKLNEYLGRHDLVF